MKVQWKTDADAALAEAKEGKTTAAGRLQRGARVTIAWE